MRNQAGFGVGKREYVYSGYCNANNYIADPVDQSRIICIPKIECKNTRFLQRSTSTALLPHHVTTPAEAARHHALTVERRQEITDKIVTWAAAAMLLGSLVAARWI